MRSSDAISIEEAPTFFVDNEFANSFIKNWHQTNHTFNQDN